MLRILDRYILREVFPSFLLGIGVFTFVILLNEILRFAQRLVSQSASFADTVITNNLLPLILFSSLLGLDLGWTAAAYGFTMLLENSHHANHTFHLGWLRFVFMDNHTHKLHHLRRGTLINHGALFSVWDILHGTYVEDWDHSSSVLHQRRVAAPVRRSEPAI